MSGSLVGEDLLGDDTEPWGIVSANGDDGVASISGPVEVVETESLGAPSEIEDGGLELRGRGLMTGDLVTVVALDLVQLDQAGVRVIFKTIREVKL